MRVAERAQVVKGVAAAEQEHAFLPQRREGATEREMLARVEPLFQRELQDGDVRVGIGELQRDECAMVVAALAIFSCGKAGSRQQLAHARREYGVAGCRPDRK